MKMLKFHSTLVPLILSGEKNSTWRLFDDKNLSVGDDIELREFGKAVSFATARITRLIEKPFKDLTEDDMVGHEKFANDEEMYERYKGYYQKEVGPETLVKIMWFDRLHVL